MKCRDCDGPMASTELRRGGTRWDCVVCGHHFTVRPKPAENAAEPLAGEPRRWWHS
jgi:hypothetical protein